MTTTSWIRALALAATAVTAASAHAAPAPRTFDLVTYQPPDGFAVDGSATDHVVLARATDKTYCVIAIYASAAAGADLDASFASQWTQVALHTIDNVAAPAATRSPLGNARGAIGAAASTVQGKPVIAMLTVIDAGASVQSILVLTPDAEGLQACTPALQGLLKTLSVRRVEPAESTPPPPDSAPRRVPAPTRPLTLKDVAGTWKHDDSALTRYVSTTTGAYAGFDSIATREAWTIAAKGTVDIDFLGTTAGTGGARQLSEKRTAAISIADGVLSIKFKKGEGADQRYLIRGWLVGPDVTLLVINGPWYDSIPDDVRRDPSIGTNLDQTWVRRTKR